jgi:hypothetical protein
MFTGARRAAGQDQDYRRGGRVQLAAQGGGHDDGDYCGEDDTCGGGMMIMAALSYIHTYTMVAME